MRTRIEYVELHKLVIQEKDPKKNYVKTFKYKVLYKSGRVREWEDVTELPVTVWNYYADENARVVESIWQENTRFSYIVIQKYKVG